MTIDKLTARAAAMSAAYRRFETTVAAAGFDPGAIREMVTTVQQDGNRMIWLVESTLEERMDRSQVRRAMRLLSDYAARSSEAHAALDEDPGVYDTD